MAKPEQSIFVMDSLGMLRKSRLLNIQKDFFMLIAVEKTSPHGALS
jgi:hypothetical protein